MLFKPVFCLTLCNLVITNTLEPTITNVGKINPRNIRNQLYKTPMGVAVDQYGAQL